MYPILLNTHSVLRYFVLFLLVAVVIRALIGWLNNRTFSKTDDRFSLWLLIVTHTQFVAGVILYFVSPVVQFNSQTMKDGALRYWAVEHVFMMIIAIALITVARVTHKKLSSDQGKFKRLFWLNIFALLIILVAIIYSGRGVLIPTRMD